MLSLKIHTFLFSLATAVITAVCAQTVFADGVIEVYIDPGHGGSNEGTETYYINWEEVDINLIMAKALQDTLDFWGTSFGGDVIYTRLTDTKIPVAKRPTLRTRSMLELSLEVHHLNHVRDTYKYYILH